LSKRLSSKTILDSFHQALSKCLLARYAGHWYEDDQLRGSAYRCISYDCRLDPVLIMAANAVGLQDNLENLLSSCRSTIMFINPGIVSIANADAEIPAKIIYERKISPRGSSLPMDSRVYFPSPLTISSSSPSTASPNRDALNESPSRGVRGNSVSISPSKSLLLPPAAKSPVSAKHLNRGGYSASLYVPGAAPISPSTTQHESS